MGSGVKGAGLKTKGRARIIGSASGQVNVLPAEDAKTTRKVDRPSHRGLHVGQTGTDDRNDRGRRASTWTPSSILPSPRLTPRRPATRRASPPPPTTAEASGGPRPTSS